MSNFSKKIRKVFFERKGVDIDKVDFIDMPESRENYNLDKIIGNVNLVEGRFMIKSEANKIIDEFLMTRLP
ncbi:MAG: hypothetical protein IKU01_08975 [Bacteroidales bacterium]|nr:hypothetical protein [Bacteroidales bacterium]